MKKDRRIEIMGILNLTDDSYFAESRCADEHAALKRAERLLAEGADIIQKGGAPCPSNPERSRSANVWAAVP